MEQKYNFSLWGLAIPIAVESLFQKLFGFADTFVLSSYSDEAVAAVGYVNQVLDIILLLFRVIASGTSILLAQAIGSEDRKEQNRICTAACWLSVILGFLSSFCMVFGREVLLKVLGMDFKLLTYGEEYLKIMGTGLIFSSLFTVLSAIYRSSGKAAYTSAIAIGSNLVNIIGDMMVVNGVLRVFGTVMDVALVTVFSNGVSAFAAFLLLLTEQMLERKSKQAWGEKNGQREDRRVEAGFFFLSRPHPDSMASILRLGIPAAGESCSYKCSQLIVTMMIGHLGSQVLAAKIYAANFSAFIVILPNSIAIATGIIVGVLAGGGKIKEAGKEVFFSIKKGAIAIAVADGILIISGKFLLSQFTQNAEILQMAYSVITIEAFTMFLRNINLSLGNSLRAIKDVMYPVVLSVFSMWLIGTGLAGVMGILLPFGLIGVYVASFFDEFLRSFLMFKRWMKKTS